MTTSYRKANIFVSESQHERKKEALMLTDSSKIKKFRTKLHKKCY